MLCLSSAVFLRGDNDDVDDSKDPKPEEKEEPFKLQTPE